MANLLHHSLLDPAASWLDLPNLLTFAKKNEGGSSDEEDEEEDDDDEEDDEKDDEKGTSKKSKNDDEDDDEDDEDDEPLSEKAKGILRKNRRSARQANARAKAAEKELERLRKGGEAHSGDDADAAEKLAEAEARGAKKGQDIAISASVRAALTSNGLAVGDDASKALKRAMRLIDLEDLTLNDDGTVDGLDDAIDDLKEEMPSLFRKPKAKRQGINGNDSRDGRGTSKAPKTSAEKLANRLG